MFRVPLTQAISKVFADYLAAIVGNLLDVKIIIFKLFAVQQNSFACFGCPNGQHSSSIMPTVGRDYKSMLPIWHPAEAFDAGKIC